MTLARPRALLFDWDNTLVDTWHTIHRALTATFEAMGRTPWTLEQTRARVRASARDSFPLLFGARAAEAAEIFYGAFESEHLTALRARAGAEEMLRSLAADGGLYLGVVSNKQGRLLRQEAEHLAWTGFFARLVGAGDAARDKPAAEAVELALDGAGMAPGPDVWFVGDTDIDMLCARDAGCVPVLLRADAPADGEFSGIEPRLHAPSCAAFLETFRLL